MRYLKFTMTFDADPIGRGTIVQRGTPESDMTKEQIAQVPDHKWATDAGEEPEIVEVAFEDMNYDQLRAIADREGVEIGRLKNPDKIREVLLDAGIGISV